VSTAGTTDRGGHVTRPLAALRAAAAALRDSPLRFDDHGQYRVEIPSVEGVSAFEAVVAAAQEYSVPLHRISQGSGITLLRDDDLRGYAEIGARHGIEVCLFVGPRAPWTGESASALAADGKYFGWRHLSVATLAAAYDDVLRAAGLGIRSVLVADEGLVQLIGQGRRDGELPADLVVKASAVLGIANPLGARLLADLGVDTVNVAGDIAAGDLAALRSVVQVPVDLYVEGPDGLGGFVRYHEIGEIVRVGAPIHLKFGLRNAPNIYPSGAHLDAVAVSTGIERVRRAAIGLEHLHRQAPQATASPTGAPRRGVPLPPS
jgi:hypothetical protein